MMIDTNQKDNSWCGNCVEFKIYVVNKVLLEQDQTHLFNIIYGYFWQTMWLAKLSMFAIRPLKKANISTTAFNKNTCQLLVREKSHRSV